MKRPSRLDAHITRTFVQAAASFACTVYDISDKLKMLRPLPAQFVYNASVLGQSLLNAATLAATGAGGQSACIQLENTTSQGSPSDISKSSTLVSE